MVYSSKLTSCTARDVPGKSADQILRMEESSLDAVLEDADTMVALERALWEESVLHEDAGQPLAFFVP